MKGPTMKGMLIGSAVLLTMQVLLAQTKEQWYDYARQLRDRAKLRYEEKQQPQPNRWRQDEHTRRCHFDTLA